MHSLRPRDYPKLYPNSCIQTRSIPNLFLRLDINDKVDYVFIDIIRDSWRLTILLVEN